MHDVGKDDAPLWVIPKSHLLGVTKFPHNLQALDEKKLEYQDDRSLGLNCLTLTKSALVGQAGSVYFWHSNILHDITQQHH